MSDTALLEEILDQIELSGLSSKLTSRMRELVCTAGKRHGIEPSEQYMRLRFSRSLMDMHVAHAEICRQLMDRFSTSRSNAYRTISEAFHAAPYSTLPIKKPAEKNTEKLRAERLDGMSARTEKRCAGCLQTLLLENFYKQGKYLTPRCKTCLKNIFNEWRQNNRAKHDANLRRLAAKNMEKIAEYSRRQLKERKDSLHDSYVISCHLKRIPRESLTAELIDACRLRMQITRTLKEAK